MEILHYNIETAMGEVTQAKDQLDFLSEKEIREFNLIGYCGTDSKNKPQTQIQFLNSLKPTEKFTMKQTRFDDGTYVEEFLITRVIF